MFNLEERLSLLPFEIIHTYEPFGHIFKKNTAKIWVSDQNFKPTGVLRGAANIFPMRSYSLICSAEETIFLLFLKKISPAAVFKTTSILQGLGVFYESGMLSVFIKSVIFLARIYIMTNYYCR